MNYYIGITPCSLTININIHMAAAKYTIDDDDSSEQSYSGPFDTQQKPVPSTQAQIGMNTILDSDEEE